MRDVIAFIAFIIMLAAFTGPAMAAPAVNLKSLSPDGAMAILTYDKHWVEVDLRLDGGARPILPPDGCTWTSMSYAPDAGDLAMIAYCAKSRRDCTKATSRVFIRQPGASARQEIARMDGGRWSGAYWRANGRRIILLETLVKQPVVMGLNDLNRNVRRCGWEDATLKVVDTESGRLITFDILPSEWRPKTIISANEQFLVAVIAAKPGVNDGSSAAAAIKTLCDDPATIRSRLKAVCKAGGYDLVMTWIDGDWRLGAGDRADQTAFHGRAIATPSGETLVKEKCETRVTSVLHGVACTLTIWRDGEVQRIDAPAGQFGDVSLSGDGMVLAAMWAGRSTRNRRFDIWDLATGERRSLAELLSPVEHYGAWPPVR